MPLEEGDDLLDLPEECRIDNFAALDGARNFADLWLAWNEFGMGVKATVRGKENSPQGDATRPEASDGLTLWLDTRDARTNRRAGRHCHQFHLLPAAAGPERDEAVVLQTPIRRATENAPLTAPGAIPFRSRRIKRGYELEAFFPAAVLNGFDPEHNPRLGFFYLVRDGELGEQTLGAGVDLPYAEDPALWQTLELVRDPKAKGR
jgi:hypothetical protein